MKGKNKPDNLEKFFQRVLGEYEEDPGIEFWDRIADSIPAKPDLPSKSFTYRGWMIIAAFLLGLLMSSTLLYWYSNAKLISSLENQLIEKNEIILKLKNEINALKQSNDQLIAFNSNNSNEIFDGRDNLTDVNSKKETARQPTYLLPKKAKKTVMSTEKMLIKPEIARNSQGVATAFDPERGVLPPFVFANYPPFSTVFNNGNELTSSFKSLRLLYDHQLISNSFFAQNSGTIKNKDNEATSSGIIANFAPLSKVNPTTIDFDNEPYQFSDKERRVLYRAYGKSMQFGLGNDALTSFITMSINPVSGYKYNLDGYKRQPTAIVETAGITSSWNWGVTAGIETKSKWSVQMGFDYNKLSIVKESINNIRFKAAESRAVNGGYVYSFNHQSDGSLGQVIVNNTIFNQQKNDGQDILDGDLFKLSVSTEQPVKILRLPILGGYRMDLSKRFYITPKLGVSAVWKIKEQTQFRMAQTFSDRLSIQKSAIFLTTKTTTESLEANFRAEFGYRWRPRWYLVAEPRFKYSGKSLFSYKDLELRDAPFHLMVGIRFNVD